MDPSHLFFILFPASCLFLGFCLFTLVQLRRENQRALLFRSALANLSEPCQIATAKGKEIYANPAFAALFPNRKSQSVPAILCALPEYREFHGDLMSIIEKIAKGRKHVMRIPLFHPPRRSANALAKSGHLIAYPLALERHVMWLLSATPPTDDGNALHGWSSALFAALDTALIGFWCVDAKGRFLRVNRTLCKWLNVEPVRLLSGETRLRDLLTQPPADNMELSSPFLDVDQRDGQVHLRHRRNPPLLLWVTQGEVHTNADGQKQRYALVRAPEQETLAEKAIAKSERRFEELFERAPVGIALLSMHGYILRLNGVFMRVLHTHARSVLQGRLLFDCVAEKSRTAVRTALRQLLQKSGDVLVRVQAQTMCGKFSTEMFLSFLHDQAGEKRIQVYAMDITKRKNLEKEIIQSRKMQAIGQLAGGVAHDFNNVLTAIIGFADILLNQRATPDDRPEIVQIKQNAQRAAGLVRHLLAFSRQETVQMQVVNPVAVLRKLTRTLQQTLGEHIALRLQCQTNVWPVKVSPVQLEQVIINLAVNARDAMPMGGTLSLSLSNRRVEDEHMLHGEIVFPGPYVLIRVSDQGNGMPPEVMEHIFDPFFSTKKRGAGTGLGLSTTYGVIRQFDGHIEVESTVGKGTAFSIYLPRAREKLTTPMLEKKESENLTGKGTILLVEDENAVRTFAARSLQQNGYHVVEKKSGQEALELLRENKHFDLLITDVVMPAMGGVELVEQAHKEQPHLPVIFISGYAEDAFQEQIKGGQGSAKTEILPKPFTLRQLAVRVKEILSQENSERKESAEEKKATSSLQHLKNTTRNELGVCRAKSRKRSTPTPTMNGLLGLALNQDSGASLSETWRVARVGKPHPKSTRDRHLQRYAQGNLVQSGDGHEKDMGDDETKSPAGFERKCREACCFTAVPSIRTVRRCPTEGGIATRPDKYIPFEGGHFEKSSPIAHSFAQEYTEACKENGRFFPQFPAGMRGTGRTLQR